MNNIEDNKNIEDNEDIYETIRTELMIFLDSIIEKINKKNKKNVTFSSIIRVCIIPNRDYYLGDDFLFADIWWKQTDIQFFRQTEILKLSKYMKEHPGANIQQFYIDITEQDDVDGLMK